MNFDIATPEGMANAVMRQTQSIAKVATGGRWIAAGRWDTFEIYEIDHEHKVARVCIGVTPNPAIIKVFAAMGWQVVEPNRGMPIPEYTDEKIEEDCQRKLRYKAKADAATKNLYNAVRRGDLKSVVALLARGANASAPAPDGSRLIDLAISKGFDAIATELQDAGGDNIAPQPRA